jgi:plastocyanin
VFDVCFFSFLQLSTKGEPASRSTSQSGGELNSGSIEADASWSHTFGQAGTFPYYCTYHPEMKGIIVVK